MVVLSREPGMSIHIASADESCVVTLLKVHPDRRAIGMLVNRTSVSRPGELDSQSLELTLDATVGIGKSTEITLVDLRGEKARIGINAPSQTSVLRLEVSEAIKRGGPGGNLNEGTAGSPVPRPPSPKPPSLNVRLDEPPSDNDGGV